jgi:hypothetical protein
MYDLLKYDSAKVWDGQIIEYLKSGNAAQRIIELFVSTLNGKPIIIGSTIAHINKAIWEKIKLE